jgi:hypothetical protein
VEEISELLDKIAKVTIATPVGKGERLKGKGFFLFFSPLPFSLQLPRSLLFTDLGLTHELLMNLTLRLLPYVAMTQVRYFCVSPVIVENYSGFQLRPIQ